MTDPLAPYDAVLLVSYGGPDGPEDVLPFLRNATAGRNIPDERLLAVGEHYTARGGRSPINVRNAELVAALTAELAGRGSAVPVVVGNRNWHPFVTETLVALADQGARRILLLLTSAYPSYSGCRQYREDVAKAVGAVEEERGVRLEIDKVDLYAESEGFVVANADAVTDALRSLGSAERVLFVTHSIPLAMADASGPGTPGGGYVATHERVAAAVADRLAADVGAAPEWELAYCSRSGPPQMPWLEPDVNDRLRELAADGVRSVVLAPIGFVSDHMEVVHDLDVEAAATASELGMTLGRAATAGTHPAFVAGLVDLLCERAAVTRGERGTPSGARYRCAEDCCRSGRPGPAPTAVCSA